MKINHLGLDLYEYTLENGLKIYVCPMDRRNIHASIVTRFGSDILEFKVNGKDKVIPAGTAHFLEHKVFAMEDGSDPMARLEANGAVSNAYTSSKMTRYYFNGPTHFKENLNILLDYVTKPYFTKENVLKEQGIILEELKASFDNPWGSLYYMCIKNAFVNHPHKYPVVGYKKTIESLSFEDLYDTYNTFYNPSNMFMVVTGNVDPKEVYNIVSNYFKDKKYSNSKIEHTKCNEPKNVYKKRSEKTMDVTNKLVSITYKIPFNSDIFKTKHYLYVYLDTLFGEMSDFYNDTFNDKNIVNMVSCYIDRVDNYYLVELDAEVVDDESIIEKINELINSYNFNEEDFNILVKNNLNSLVINTENPSGVANMIVTEEIDCGQFHTDIYDKYKELNFNEYKEYISKLDFSHYTVNIIKPRNH